MKKYLTFMLLLSVGCAASVQQKVKTVMDKYAKVNFEDGIDLKDAEIIAQRALAKQNLADRYDIEQPQIVRDIAELPNHEKHWFFSFKENGFSSIEYVFMVVVEKETGKVKFADDIQEDKKWILEAALLK
ncbi:MAG: hypothetical protein A3C36_03010 [Omnitrophica WOR_2 bacterium RIFCSPHIGHO2_02_FULL_52_10]|nr:MAG: hypothetical protein A3C36_03010 [Omnitrophica WOR_2 bacterium RIFCSPHIGHO2_02_FULL_52_10]